MSSGTAGQKPQITTRKRPRGGLYIDLMLAGESVSRLSIVPFTLHVGTAAIQMDGIGGVATLRDHRHMGYARQVLEAAVARMRSGPASISMLYGIEGFYPKFGFATAGPDHFLRLGDLSEEQLLPEGWRARDIEKKDLEVAARLYDDAVRDTVGAAVRTSDGAVWTRLADRVIEDDGTEDCRILEDPSGRVVAYAWRDVGGWYKENLEKEYPGSMVISEVIAVDSRAGEAALTMCRQWAKQTPGRTKIKSVILPLPPESAVGKAAMRQSCEIVSVWAPCGGSMARVLNVSQLLQELAPELERRLEAAGSRFFGQLILRTDIGDSILALTRAGSARPGSAGDRSGAEGLPTAVLTIPQFELARLALGVFPPDEILDRLETPPPDRDRHLLATLFPQRHPHMYLPDRF